MLLRNEEGVTLSEKIAVCTGEIETCAFNYITFTKENRFRIARVL